MSKEIFLHDAFARCDGDVLTIGNRDLERKIDLSAGYPRTVAFTGNGNGFAATQNDECDCSFFGLNMPGKNETV